MTRPFIISDLTVHGATPAVDYLASLSGRGPDHRASFGVSPADGAASTWLDSNTLLGADGSQGTGTLQPIHDPDGWAPGVAWLNFDGANDTIGLEWSPATITSLMIAYVFDFDSIIGSRKVWSAYDSAAGEIHVGVGSSQMMVEDSGAPQFLGATTSGVHTHIWYLASGASASEVFVDGSSFATFTITLLGALDGETNRVQYCCDAATPQHYADGKFGRSVAYLNVDHRANASLMHEALIAEYPAP